MAPQIESGRGCLFGCAGMLALVMGMALILLGAAVETLVCHRTTAEVGSCTFTHKAVFGSRTEQFSLSEMFGARVEQTIFTIRKRTVIRYHVILKTQRRELPVMGVYILEQESAYQISQAINAFIADDAVPSLLLEQDDRRAIFLWSALLIVPGLLAVWWWLVRPLVPVIR